LADWDTAFMSELGLPAVYISKFTDRKVSGQQRCWNVQRNLQI